MRISHLGSAVDDTNTGMMLEVAQVCCVNASAITLWISDEVAGLLFFSSESSFLTMCKQVGWRQLHILQGSVSKSRFNKV